MVDLSPQLRSALLAEAERARIAVDASSCSIARWDRIPDTMTVLVNVGHLTAGYERLPADESYPLDSFPAMAALVRERRPYLDPTDVSSMALTARMGYATHAAVPIVVEEQVWGELWVCRHAPDAAFARADVDRLLLVSDRLGDALAPYV